MGSRLKRMIFLALFLALTTLHCATVRVYEREKLADPIMERESRFAKQTLAQKFFLTREGSIGGGLGISGGCGCAK